MEVVNGALTRHSLEEQEEQEDTWVFPLVQMKPLGIQVDEQVTQVRGHMTSSTTRLQDPSWVRCEVTDGVERFHVSQTSIPTPV